MHAIKHKILKYFRGHNPAFHIIAAIIWIWALSMLFVLGMGLTISFLDGREYALHPDKLFQSTFKFENYLTAIKTIKYNDAGYFEMIFNSIWFSVGCTVARLFATTLSAYVVARYNFRGKKLFYGLILLQLMLPTYGAGISNYKLLLRFGMINSPLFLLGQFAGHGTYFLILNGFFSNLSQTYSESAKMDGATDTVIFLKIMLPMARASIAAIGIMTFVGLWNDYGTPLIYLDKYPTLMTGLFRYRTIAAYSLDTPVYFAGVFLSAVPIAIIFIVFNKILMENLTIGGIKG